MWVNKDELPNGDRFLWACVIRRTVFDYVLYKGVGSKRLEWKLAHRYIFGDHRPSEGLTFDEACELFGWNPDWLRRLVRRMKREDIRRLEMNKFLDMFETAPFSADLRFAQWNSMPGMVPYGMAAVYAKRFDQILGLRCIRRPDPPSPPPSPYLSFLPEVSWGTLTADG